MQHLKGVLRLWKTVFSSGRSVFVLLAVAVAFYLFNAIVSNLGNLFYTARSLGFVETISWIVTLITGFHRTILPSSVLSIILIGLLTGLLMSLLLYRFTMHKAELGANTSFLSSIGLFLGIFAPGCAACGIGLAGALGIGTSLAVLPFQGKEISVLAMLVLSYAIGRTSLSLTSSASCPVPSNKTKRRLR